MCVALLATRAVAQEGRTAQTITSMGQPRRFEPYGVASEVAARRPNGWFGALTLGVHRPLTNPVTGLFGVAAEGSLYMRQEGDAPKLGPRARVLATSRVFGLSGGAEIHDHIRSVIAFQTAILRGGVVGHGTMLRLDWMPSEHRLGAGIVLPLGRPYAGRSRNRDTDADMPPSERTGLTLSPISRAAQAALTRVGYAASQVLAYTNLYAEDTAVVRYGRSYTQAVRSYRDELTNAFRAAANDWSQANGVTARARAGLLDDVILPYDSLFGQAKDGGIRSYTASAQTHFVRWLSDSSGVADSMRPGLATVHARWLGVIEGVHANLLAQWRDSRLVWLPLQLALTEEQYDEQTEVDRLVERAVGRSFTDNNALTYLRSSDLPLEIARSIFAARDYHVLWTHDYTGRREITREIDEVAYTMTADAYLPALTRAVSRYDSAGTMPVYMILLDQFYYEQRQGTLWMSILEDPLNAKIKLPGQNGEREAHLRRRQLELRNAVAQSRRLQREAAAHGGSSWLRRVVRVHVNIVLPSDFSFRSGRILPGVPFMPDNVQRDHRKIAFYDVSEADPYRGAAILMGVGVGEHYASATWEDRGYRIRGPAALEARDAARRALRGNGLRVEQLPAPLRASETKQPTTSAEQYVGRALQVHNEAGFGAKESTVARAMLYNLAPPGSVIIVPDPLWVSETWAAMLADAASRGCRVFVISPSLANGPNPQPPVVAVQHDVMLRMIDIARRIGPQIKAAGGELRLGLYTARSEVTDLAGRRREITEGLRRAPWIKEVIPFDSATLAVLNPTVTQAEADGGNASTIAKDEKPRAPQLHQKTQLIARPGAIAALTRQPGWDRVLVRAMEAVSAQTAKFADQIGYIDPEVDSAATRADAVLRGYETGLSDADRKAVSFYFSLGSQNQDPRGIMQDGEASVIVSGLHAAAGLVDLYYVMARSTWIDDRAQLDRLLPRPRGLQARLARFIRLVL